MAEPIQSVDGWVVFVTGLHSDATEDDVYDAFAHFGKIKSLHLNLSQRTGLRTGTCLVKFLTRQSAQEAVEANGSSFGDGVAINWAFVKGNK